MVDVSRLHIVKSDTKVRRGFGTSAGAVSGLALLIVAVAAWFVFRNRAYLTPDAWELVLAQIQATFAYLLFVVVLWFGFKFFLRKLFR